METVQRLDEDDSGDSMETVFPNVAAFVKHWLLPTYRRNPSKHRWDPKWWEYQEVTIRLEALWRAFEFYRLEGPTGMGVFFRDHLDPTMREITSDNGPFWKMHELGKERTIPTSWPSEDPPAGMF